MVDFPPPVFQSPLFLIPCVFALTVSSTAKGSLLLTPLLPPKDPPSSPTPVSQILVHYLNFFMPSRAQFRVALFSFFEVDSYSLCTFSHLFLSSRPPRRIFSFLLGYFFHSPLLDPTYETPSESYCFFSSLRCSVIHVVFQTLPTGFPPPPPLLLFPLVFNPPCTWFARFFSDMSRRYDGAIETPSFSSHRSSVQ